MSKGTLSIFGFAVAGLVLLATTSQGCGGSSGTSAADIASLCNQGCKTGVMCSQGLLTMDKCVEECTKAGQTSAGGTCTNQDAIIAKAKMCAALTDCTAYFACGQDIPECEGGSGSAGTSGTAGATGTAGHTGAAGATGAAGHTGAAGATGAAGSTGTTGGTTCTTACAKADACCAAVNALAGQTSPCMFESSCTAAGAQSAQYVSICNQTLAGVSASPAAPAACK